VDLIFPASITAGLSFKAKLISLREYPAPEWGLAVILRGPSAQVITAQPEGAQHRLEASATATKTWAPGAYLYSVRVMRGDDVLEVERGSTFIARDLEALEGVQDVRTHARRTLDAIEAVIEKRASLDQSRYVINNRELERTPIRDLLLLKDRYAALVRREEAAARGKSTWGPAVRVSL
jgi:hypothetical protein